MKYPVPVETPFRGKAPSSSHARCCFCVANEAIHGIRNNYLAHIDRSDQRAKGMEK